MKHFIGVYLVISLAHHVGTNNIYCSRIQSRSAHAILKKSVLRIMVDKGLDLPGECPIHPDRNMYVDNERRKHSEVSSHWNCLYCGKSFFSEKFIDQHFDNRHHDTILKGPHAVCLADHCDYLRCDVISGSNKGSFWDEALCKHKEIEALRMKCQDVVMKCIPSHLTSIEKYDLKEKLEASICSYLTCEKFWENPFVESSPERTAAYIIASIFTVFGFIMYYTMACSYLYSDETFLGTSDGLVRRQGTLKERRRYHAYPSPEGQTMRNRLDR